MNDEAEYLIWPATNALPCGWRETGEVGPESELQALLQELLEDTSPAPLFVQQERGGPRSK